PAVHHLLSSAIDDPPVDTDRTWADLLGMLDRPPRRHRVATAVFALVLAAAGVALAARAFVRSSSPLGSGSPAQSILFTRSERTAEEPGFPDPRVWSVGVTGSSASPLPQPPGRNEGAVWSPDGTRIAFVGAEGSV